MDKLLATFFVVAALLFADSPSSPAADSAALYEQAKRVYAEAKLDKSNPATLIHATILFAVASRSSQDIENSRRLCDEAADDYFAMDRRSPGEPEARKDLWTHLEYLPDNSFQSKFERLLKISETKTKLKQPYQIDSDLRGISSKVGSVRNKQSGSKPFDYVLFWKTAIQIRARVRGQNSSSLIPLMENYATACEGKCKFAEAEKTYSRLSHLGSKSDSETRARIQLELAKFYLRNKMDDKAEAAYRRAFELTKIDMTQRMASKFISLTTEFGNRNPSSQLVMLIFSDLVSVGGDSIMHEIDGPLQKVIAVYIDSSELDKAHTLLLKRLDASKTCVRDSSANSWRFKLFQVEALMSNKQTQSPSPKP